MCLDPEGFGISNTKNRKKQRLTSYRAIVQYIMKKRIHFRASSSLILPKYCNSEPNTRRVNE